MESKRHTDRSWDSLDKAEQTALLIEYGHYLDSLPPTCSLQTKNERFISWLQQRGIQYSADLKASR